MLIADLLAEGFGLLLAGNIVAYGVEAGAIVEDQREVDRSGP